MTDSGSGILWTEPGTLLASVDEAGRPLRAPRIKHATFLEIARHTLTYIDLDGLTVRLPGLGRDLGAADLRAAFRSPGFAKLGPPHGHDGRVTLLDGTHLDPIAAPLFSGSWDVCWRTAWGLPAEQRASVFLFSHDEIVDPAQIEARRPAEPAPGGAWRKLRMRLSTGMSA